MKPIIGLRIEMSDETGSGGKRQIREKPVQWARERQRRQWARERQRRQLAKGDTEGQLTTDSRRDQSGEIESRGSEEDRQDEFAVLSQQRSSVRKTVRDELAFLVACRSFVKTTRQR